jgi:hypothetical protein
MEGETPKEDSNLRAFVCLSVCLLVRLSIYTSAVRLCVRTSSKIHSLYLQGVSREQP